jgi:hypothetical protein
MAKHGVPQGSALGPLFFSYKSQSTLTINSESKPEIFTNTSITIKRLSHWEQHETQGNKTNKGNKAKQKEHSANIAARNTGHTQQ